MNKENIKSLVQAAGWQEVKSEFLDEIAESKKTDKIKTEGISAECIALEVMSSNKAAKIVKNVIAKIERLANEDPLKDKKSYI